LPQAPQRAGEVTSVSQPSPAAAVQCARDGRHALVTSHAPATQRTASATTPVSAVQSLPHRPQLCGSREVSVQAP
jgi:hypothetical protein